MDTFHTPPDEKRFAIRLLTDANTQIKAEFACHCVTFYKSEEWTGSIFPEYFDTDFYSFSKEDFAAFDDTHSRRI